MIVHIEAQEQWEKAKLMAMARAKANTFKDQGDNTKQQEKVLRISDKREPEPEPEHEHALDILDELEIKQEVSDSDVTANSVFIEDIEVKDEVDMPSIVESVLTQNEPEPEPEPRNENSTITIRKPKRVIIKSNPAETSPTPSTDICNISSVNWSLQDPVDAFLIGIAPSLKALSPFRFHMAKREIFSIVHKHELLMLRPGEPKRQCLDETSGDSKHPKRRRPCRDAAVLSSDDERTQTTTEQCSLLLPTASHLS